MLSGLTKQIFDHFILTLQKAETKQQIKNCTKPIISILTDIILPYYIFLCLLLIAIIILNIFILYKSRLFSLHRTLLSI